MSEQEFRGKVALVTGGASGIGEACALTFARGGARVVVADMSVEAGEHMVGEMKKLGAEAIFVRVDVADPESVQSMVEATMNAFGRLDIAVNNAGISGELARTGEYSIEGWRKVLEVNLDGVFYCMRYEIPKMLEQGSGSIVNMASILGSVGFAKSAAYVAAKHGVVGLTKAAALEYGRQGIRINAVGPGFIRTPLLTETLSESVLEHLGGLHALGRMGESQEVADLVAFLGSDKSSFLTGGYYLADGGYTAQ